MVTIYIEYTYVQPLADILSVISVLLLSTLNLSQVIKVFKVKNTQGILRELLELLSLSIIIAYHFRNKYRLLTYLEYPIILTQQCLLTAYIMYYKKQIGLSSIPTTVAYVLLLAAFLSDLVPREFLIFLLPFCIPIAASSRIVRLISTIQSQNSENLSTLTWYMSIFGSLVYVDSGDIILLLHYTVNAIMYILILLTTYYRHSNLLSKSS